MAEVYSLTATPRDGAGKGSARAARRDGKVPAVIYGNKEEPLTIAVERRALEHELHKPGFFIRLVDVQVDGLTHRVLPRDVQFHPVTDVPLHVDFLRFSRDRKITVAVPVSFENEDDSPGLKRGGVLNVVRYEVEVQATADNLPTTIHANLAGMDIGDSLHASSVTLPEGVEFAITDRDFTIATVAAPTVVAEEAAEEAAEGEGAAAAAGEAPAAEAGGEEESAGDCPVFFRGGVGRA